MQYIKGLRCTCCICMTSVYSTPLTFGGKSCLKQVKVKALFIYIADRKASAYAVAFLLRLLSTPQHYHWYAATHSTSPEGIW